MTIVIELSQEQEAYITTMAQQQGVTVQTVIEQLINAHLVSSPDTALSPVVTTDSDQLQVATDDEEQYRLHALLQGLFDHSDMLERQPGIFSTKSLKAQVAEIIREKHRSQGLQV